MILPIINLFHLLFQFIRIYDVHSRSKHIRTLHIRSVECHCTSRSASCIAAFGRSLWRLIVLFLG